MVMKLNMQQGEETNNHQEEEDCEAPINELGEREEIESEDRLSSTNINLTTQSRWSTFQSETDENESSIRRSQLQTTTTTIHDQANFITDSNDTADATDWMTPISQTTVPSTLNQITSRVPTSKDSLQSSIRYSNHSLNHSSGSKPPIGSRWPSNSTVAATSYRFIEPGDDNSKAEEASPNSFGSRNQRPTPSKRSRSEQSTVSNTFALPASYNSGNHPTRNQLSSASNYRAPFFDQTNRSVNTTTGPTPSLNSAASPVLTPAPIPTSVGSTTTSTSRWSSFTGDEEHPDGADSSSLKKPKLSHLSGRPITASLTSTSNHFQQTYHSHPIHDHDSSDATPRESWMSSTHTTTNVIGLVNSTSTTNRHTSTPERFTSFRPLIMADNDSFESSSSSRLILSRPINPPSLPFSSLSSRPSSTTISSSLGSFRPQSTTSLHTPTDSTSDNNSRWAGFQDED